MLNCTVARNVGYGVLSDESAKGHIRNTVMYYNKGAMSGNWAFYDTSLYAVFTCTAPLAPGEGNISGDPQFADPSNGDYRLLPGSPCIDAGQNEGWMTAETDRYGGTRLVGGKVDLGAHEYSTGSLVCNAIADRQEGVAPFTNVITAYVDGTNTSGLTYRWDIITNGVVSYSILGQTAITNVFTNIGSYTVSLTMSNAVGESDTVLKKNYIRIGPPTVYVSTNGSHTSPFSSWATAATNIQDAVDIGTKGTTALVTNGVYALADQIIVSNGVTLLSVKGWTNTIVVGGESNRCFLISHEDAILDGFLITGGNGGSGGGVYGLFGGTLRNCRIEGNRTGAWRDGGGVGSYYGISVQNCEVVSNTAYSGGGIYCEFRGTIDGCLVSGNRARYGGGIACYDSGSITNCRILLNTATNDGGGFVCYDDGLVVDCVVSSNTAYRDGGGGVLSESLADRCLAVDNTAGDRGGGMYISAWASGQSQGIRNSLVAGNTATNGGGIFCNNAAVENCTIVNNTATNGGGIYCRVSQSSADLTLRNSIIYYNSASVGPNHYEQTSYYSHTNCCTVPPNPASSGCITNPPLFVDAATDNYRLKPSSPCVDTGINLSWMFAAVDLDGNRRVLNSDVDMGCYELPFVANLRFFLEGPFRTTNHLMATELATGGHVPLISPYVVDVRTVPAMPSNVTDWVLIQLQDPGGESPFFSRSAVLNSDGYVLSEDGSTGIVVDVSYSHTNFVLVKHRNHIAAISATPLLFTNQVVSYDFSMDSVQFHGGTNACVQLEPGVWGMIAGDADGDGKITHVDRKICEEQQGQTGYKAGDFNLDGVVDGND